MSQHFTEKDEEERQSEEKKVTDTIQQIRCPQNYGMPSTAHGFYFGSSWFVCSTRQHAEAAAKAMFRLFKKPYLPTSKCNLCTTCSNTLFLPVDLDYHQHYDCVRTVPPIHERNHVNPSGFPITDPYVDVLTRTTFEKKEKLKVIARGRMPNKVGSYHHSDISAAISLERKHLDTGSADLASLAQYIHDKRDTTKPPKFPYFAGLPFLMDISKFPKEMHPVDRPPPAALTPAKRSATSANNNEQEEGGGLTRDR